MANLTVGSMMASLKLAQQGAGSPFSATSQPSPYRAWCGNHTP
jgi:hypothetical protein